MYIAFEGIDGCGKTTQSERLCRWLNNKIAARSIHVREPGGTDFGNHLRDALLGEFHIPPVAEMLTYAADRAALIDHIRMSLNLGRWVISDRCYMSTITYQGYGRKISLPLINKLNAIATDGVLPALVFWLDLDPEIALKRAISLGKLDRIEQESLEFHQRVRQGYAHLYTANKSLIKRINAELTEDQVFEQILNELNGVLNAEKR